MQRGSSSQQETSSSTLVLTSPQEDSDTEMEQDKVAILDEQEVGHLWRINQSQGAVSYVIRRMLEKPASHNNHIRNEEESAC